MLNGATIYSTVCQYVHRTKRHEVRLDDSKELSHLCHSRRRGLDFAYFSGRTRPTDAHQKHRNGKRSHGQSFANLPHVLQCVRRPMVLLISSHQGRVPSPLRYPHCGLPTTSPHIRSQARSSLPHSPQVNAYIQVCNRRHRLQY